MTDSPPEPEIRQLQVQPRPFGILLLLLSFCGGIFPGYLIGQVVATANTHETINRLVKTVSDLQEKHLVRMEDRIKSLEEEEKSKK